MNYLQKKDAYKRSLGLLGQHYGSGLIKLSNETIEHFTVKCQVAHYCYKNGWQVFSECNLKGGGRADLVILNKANGDIYAIEVLKSETEKMCNEKNYPIPIIKVYVKGFSYDTFKI